jgi:hypothetical protein
MKQVMKLILNKICLSLFLICFLNGCVQNTVFLGPAVTVASTGSLSHAGLSYISNKAITDFTGKTPTENIKSFLTESEDKEVDSKKVDVKTATSFYKMVKKINKSSGIKDLANQ